jgi:hypothetical protein
MAEDAWQLLAEPFVDAAARVELEASLRDPQRRLSRAFHLLGARTRGE